MPGKEARGGVLRAGQFGGRSSLIVWLLVAIVAVLAAVAVASMEILAAVRAYSVGESLWSTAQKDATLHLLRYARWREEADYHEYRRRIAVTLGDRAARIELEKSSFDRETVYRGLLRGGNHPDDLFRIAAAYLWFRRAPYVAEAIDIWAEGDRLVERLDRAAGRLRDEIRSGRASAARLDPVLGEIHGLNRQFTVLEERFLSALGNAERLARRVLTALVLLTGLASVLAGWRLSSRIAAYGRDADRRQALAESEAQLRAILRDAPYAIVISRMRDRALLYTNSRVREEARVPAEVRGGQFAQGFYADPQDGEDLLRQVRDEGFAPGRELQLKDFEGRRFWVLLSAQAIRFKGEPCVLASFTNITERRNAALRQDLQARITALLADADDVGEAVRGVIRIACRTLDFACGARWILDAEAGLLRCSETWGVEDPQVGTFLDDSLPYTAPSVAEGGGIVQVVWRTGEPIWVEDIGELATFRRRASALAAGLASVLAFPILVSGEFFGVLELYARDRRPRDDDLLRLAHDLGSQIGQFIARKEAQEKLRFGAYHDPLTGLANRTAFLERLEQALALAQRHGRRLALLFIDLDGFKPVNDTLGHAAGDAVLKAIAARLRTSLRAGDLVGRMGGDEFVVLLEEAGEPGEPAEVARKLLAAVVQPVLAGGRECCVSASIGISRHPVDGKDADTLLHGADEAMYLAKAQGGNAFRFRFAGEAI